MVKSFVDSMSFCGGLQEVNNFAFLSNVIEKQLETHDSSGGKIIRKWEYFVAKRDIFVNTVLTLSFAATFFRKDLQFH